MFAKLGSKFLRLNCHRIFLKRNYSYPPLCFSPNAKLNKTLVDKYMCLPLPECKTQVKYIWIDGTGEFLRSKSRTLDYVPADHSECPNWAYDGGSTFQARKQPSDMNLCPVAMYKDPFRRGNHKLVLCEVFDFEQKPHKTNHRHWCNEALGKACDAETQFGFEQEYQLMDLDGRPFGWPKEQGEPTQTGLFYCGVGANNAYAREIVEAHYRASLYAGVDLFGTNAEVTLGQWEFQTGVTGGIKAADDLWMARFLLWRIAEEYGVAVSLHPKLFPNWNGAGCHVNFSTKKMRADNGIEAIEDAVCKLSKKHKEHIALYDPKGGEYNKLRLTGRHETSSIDKFSSDVANRGVSVRIPISVARKKKGHLEDRRPASNIDPYCAVGMLVKTILLDK